MLLDYFLIVALLSPVLLALTALLFRLPQRWEMIDSRKVAVLVSAICILCSGICGFLVINQGPLQSEFIGIRDIGFSIRLDAITSIMLMMITLLGFVIIRFSINYLDGESRQGIFIGRLAATLASIHLLVMASNIGLLFLAWIMTSILLHRLLLFYPERIGAVIAAKKKFFVARLGDFCLLIAFTLLYLEFDSGDLAVIFKGAKSFISSGGSTLKLEAAAIFLVLAALLKSAQFPTHAWLIEIMETPTPVSALLHAGLLNAGPLLIIRMAHVMDAVTIAPIVLIFVGSFTALFASAAYMTQTSIKSALGYSSVAHMGFSLMLGGFGVYSAAMLHLVAHSFYKAHAFLSSGSVIDVLRASKINTPKPATSTWKVCLGILVALTAYSTGSILFGQRILEEFSVLAVGTIITMGVMTMLISAVDSGANGNVFLKTTALVTLVLTAFLTLEFGTRQLLASELPPLSIPSTGKIILISFIVLAFASAVILQTLVISNTHLPFAQRLAIHLRNGLYANAFFDKFVNALSTYPQTVQRHEKVQMLKKVQVKSMEVEELPA